VLDGRLDVESPADGGTRVAAAIPLMAELRGQQASVAARQRPEPTEVGRPTKRRVVTRVDF